MQNINDQNKMVRKNVYLTIKYNVLLIVLAFVGLIQSCKNSRDSSERDNINPGFYKGIERESFYVFYIRVDSSGAYELRQYEEGDSSVIGQSTGKIIIENKSVHFQNIIWRSFRYTDYLNKVGIWTRWKAKAARYPKIDTSITKIRADCFTVMLGGKWVTFKIIGTELMVWPKSTNEIPDFVIEQEDSTENFHPFHRE